MASIITIATVVGATAAVAGAGVSVYGGMTAANGQRSAAAANTALTDKQADATMQVSQFQADLNYKTAIAEAGIYDQNAAVLHNEATQADETGFQQEVRQTANDVAATSADRASYGASGVTTDAGSPLAVAAYKGGVQQLQRMDTAYQTNIESMKDDWAGSLQTYQAQLTRETATQYKYASDMAAWTDQAVKAGAQVQQSVADNNANATQLQGISGAISDIGQASATIGNFYRYSSRNPAAGVGANGAGQIYPNL